MISILLASYKIWIYPLLAISFVGSTAYGVHSFMAHQQNIGYQKAVAEYTARIDKANAQAQTTLAIKNDQIAKNQTELNAAQQAIIDKSAELKNAKSDYANLRAKYADSTQRLSVRAYCQAGGTQQNSNATTTSGTSENVQLLPTVSTAILDFARDYSENLRMKNACIDLYNVAREASNK